MTQGATGFYKLSDVYSETVDKVRGAFAPAIRQEVDHAALQDALRWVGVGGLLGFGARGVRGLLEQTNRNLRQPANSVTTPAIFSVPVAQEEEKQANWFTDNVIKPIGDVADKTWSGLKGQEATDPKATWFWPMAAYGGMTAASLAGYSLHDKLLQHFRQQQQEEELQQARQEYHDALLPKSASDDSLGGDLEQLCEAHEKLAADNPETSDSLGNLLGSSGGWYGLYALLTGAMAGGAAYDYFRSGNRKSLADAALRHRRAERFSASPTPLYALPEPVPVSAAPAKKQQGAPRLAG